MLSLVGVAFSGSWLGQRLLRRVSAVAFRRFVLTMLALMGLKMILDGWPHHLHQRASGAPTAQRIMCRGVSTVDHGGRTGICARHRREVQVVGWHGLGS